MTLCVGGTLDGESFGMCPSDEYTYNASLSVYVPRNQKFGDTYHMMIAAYKSWHATQHIPKPAFGCIANTVRTLSGLMLDFADPKPDQFRFSDIASGLSKECRFARQIPSWYSVAEHSCVAAEIAIRDGLDENVIRACLMHDAHEAFMGDVVKPLKIMLTNYDEIADRLQNVIYKKFGVMIDLAYDAMKKIDQELMIYEKKTLRFDDGRKWHGEDEVRQLTGIRLPCYERCEALEWFNLMCERFGINTTI